MVATFKSTESHFAIFNFSLHKIHNNSCEFVNSNKNFMAIFVAVLFFSFFMFVHFHGRHFGRKKRRKIKILWVQSLDIITWQIWCDFWPLKQDFTVRGHSIIMSPQNWLILPACHQPRYTPSLPLSPGQTVTSILGNIKSIWNIVFKDSLKNYVVVNNFYSSRMS